MASQAQTTAGSIIRTAWRKAEACSSSVNNWRWNILDTKRLNEDVIDFDVLEDLICYEYCPTGAVLVSLPTLMRAYQYTTMALTCSTAERGSTHAAPAYALVVVASPLVSTSLPRALRKWGNGGHRPMAWLRPSEARPATRGGNAGELGRKEGRKD
ncbi:hypothetical protein QYE76_054508 [Lolium multiflorum]|uniref:Uncharacterized protein n=1 Tax=Lolium multiflorum TaxID=4521 RepID=A0AAD8SYF8_LOLMU|nr:hypothetical protein QYE76_054508 [Lolium multiflorum]